MSAFVVLENVSHAYGGDVAAPAVDDLSFAVERGGRLVNVTIPGYKYALKLASSSATGGFVGTIDHPRTSTRIGDAELTPRYGDHLGLG